MFTGNADMTIGGWGAEIKALSPTCFITKLSSLYLFESHQSCTSSASLIQAHAAHKRFHSFVPSLYRNPLDSEFCKNIIQSAKRIKSKPIAKKKPFSSQLIKGILDAYSKEYSNLKMLG